MLAAGTLKTRATIQQRGTAADALGQPVELWTTVAVVWANVRYPSGLAAVKADADLSVVKASIRLRYQAGIDAGMRVSAEGQLFNIIAVLHNRPDGYIDLVCERVS
jgi:SPP1 family predicted phage head-tail adaptor